MQDLEKYLSGYKKYQAFIYGLLFLPCFLSGAWTLVFSFTGALPRNRCCIPSLGECTDGNGTYDVFSNESSLWHSYYYFDSSHGGPTSFCYYCEPPKGMEHNFTCTQQLAKDCDSGHIYDTSQYHTSLTIKYDMVCANAWKLELSKSMFMLGVLVGAGFFGMLSDRFGRRPVFLVCAIVQMISFNIFPFLADTNFYVFQLMHILNGGVQYGTYLTGFIIIMELIQGFPRTVCGIWVQGYFAFGYIYVGICAYFIRDWKTLHWVVSAPSLLYIPYYWLLPESFRWDAVNGREEQAKATVLKCARWNKITIPKHVLNNDLKPQPVQHVTTLALFHHWSLAKNTLIVFFTWFVCSMTYYGLSLNTADLPGDDYTNFLLSGIVELPGFIICIPLMELWGRKPALVILFGVSGLCCIASGFIPHDSLSALVVTFAVIGKMCVAAAFAVIYNYSAELFPTVVRNSGTGFSSLCARIGSISAPQIHLLAHYVDDWLPIVIYGVFALMAAALDLLLPETKGVPMSETIEDGVRFCEGKGKKAGSEDREMEEQKPLSRRRKKDNE